MSGSLIRYYSIQDLQLLDSSRLKETKDSFFLSFCYPADREPHPKVRSRVGFYRLVAVLICPKGFSLPVPIGEVSFVLLPYVMDCSIITHDDEGN